MLGENLSSRGYFASILRSNVQQFFDNSFFFLNIQIVERFECELNLELRAFKSRIFEFPNIEFRS